MPIARGAVASLIFAFVWMAMVFHTRPEPEAAPNEASMLQAWVGAMETWSFAPAILHADERAAYATAKTVSEAKLALTAADAKMGTRSLMALGLVLSGMALFWGSLEVFAKKKNAVVLAGALLGPPLPCLVSMSPAGFLLSGPPLVAGIVIATITLVSKRSATS